MRRKCSCGNSNLVADKVTLVLFDVPFELGKDGPQYDDQQATYTDGWDYNQESRCHCVSCGAIYELASDDKGDLYLEPVTQEAKP